MARLLAIVAVLACSIGIAGATVVPYSGTDAGAGPADTLTNSNAAQSSLSAQLPSWVVIDFENTAAGTAFPTSFSVFGMTMTASLTGQDPAYSGFKVGTGTPTLGFNTTAGGSHYLQLSALDNNPMTLHLAFSQPIQSFGAYFTGIGNVGGNSPTLSFNDGAPQSLTVAGSGTGGSEFLGFTDAGQSINSIDLTMAGNANDVFSMDDLRFAGASDKNPISVVPEPLTCIGVFGGLASLGAYLRKRKAALTVVKA